MAERRKGRPAIKTILVPADFSDNSKEALDFAEILAKTLGAKIVLIHVIDVLSYAVTESLQWENVYLRLKASVQPLLERRVRKINKRVWPRNTTWSRKHLTTRSRKRPGRSGPISS
jgi:nucleotide-binding universal stress UspA family protein